MAISYCCKSQAVDNAGVKIDSLTANVKDGKLSVSWSANDKASANYFEIQRSDDGKTFKTIGLVMGPDPAQGNDKYAFMQKMKKKDEGFAFYRVKYNEANGGEQLSEIIVPSK